MSSKSQLINDLVDLENYLNAMYVYHPDNPEGIDVVDESKQIKKVIAKITAQIEELDSTSKS